MSNLERPKEQAKPDRDLLEESAGIDEEFVFFVMSQLSIQQRQILSLKYFENMSLSEVVLVLKLGDVRTVWCLMSAVLKVKKLLIINGHKTPTLKSFLISFGQLTEI